MKLLYLALAMLVAICPEARAAGDDAFGTVTSKGIELFNNVKTVVFVMGGFGLVGMAVGAVFGKVNWKWCAALAFGLFILAIAAKVVAYFTGTSDAGFNDSNFG